MYAIEYSKRSLAEIEWLKAAHLDTKVRVLIYLLKVDPFRSPPPFEKLTGNLRDLCSRRMNNKHRLVYQVLTERQVVRIISMWSHYERV